MSEHLENNNLIARWLEGDLSEAERQTLEESQELNDLNEVLKDVSNWKLEPYNASKGYEDLKKRLNTNANSNAGKKVVKLHSYLRFAAAAVLLFLAYFGIQQFLSGSEVTYALGTGETQHIDLPDGSTVDLDASSTLSYNTKSWPEERNLNLEGQAFFDVKKGSSFTVFTQAGEVKVLGTQFNVKSSVKSLVVICYEGSVEVSEADKKHVLNPGEGIRIMETGAIRFTTSEHTPSWKKANGNSSHYEQAPLQEVMDDLKRQYGIVSELPIEYSPLEFSGNVPRDDLERALKTIFVPMEISYSLDDGQVQFIP